MTSIRYVILSDLHFGAQNSVLTDLHVGRPEVNPKVAGEVMRCLVGCLRELLAANESWERPTLVLGGDVLELALADDHIAAMVFERFIELALAHSERVFDDTVYFVPGNHDHHLWEAARERHYADFVRTAPKDQDLTPPWHATRLLADQDDAPITAELLTALIQRDDRLADVVVRTIYPNLGLLDATGTRAVVYHHGHYSESLYRLVSTTTGIMFDRPAPQEVWEWEAENFAWVDFFWSALGRSGSAGHDVNLAYDYLQSPRATERLVDNLVRGLSHRVDHGLLQHASVPLEGIVRVAVDRIAHHVVTRERRHAELVLRADTETGLRQYIEGPLWRQLAGECGGEVPEHVTFLFGHTHKPFVGTRDYAGFHEPVAVANTGGWVVDTVEPMPLHGGAVVLLDEDLAGVLLQMYMQREHDAEYRVQVQPIPGPGSEELAAWVTEQLGDDPEPWRAFSAAAAKAVRARERDLALILERTESRSVDSDAASAAASATEPGSPRDDAGSPGTRRGRHRGR
jgi:hypothetical protein